MNPLPQTCCRFSWGVLACRGGEENEDRVFNRVRGGDRAVLPPRHPQPVPRGNLQGSGFRVQGSGCRVQCSVFRVQGAGRPGLMLLSRTARV